MKLGTTATNSNSTQRIVCFQTSCCWRFTPAAQQHSLKDVLLGNDLGNFHNFPSAFHAMEQRCAVADVPTRPHLFIVDVVIRFNIQHDSFRVFHSRIICST